MTKPVTIHWTATTTTPTNPPLTPENIQTAGPCTDPECPICYGDNAPSDGPSYTPTTTDEEPLATDE